MSGPILVVDDLRVGIPTDDGMVQAVRGVSFALEPGRALGIVGESGSGKSVTARAIMRLAIAAGVEISGEIKLGSRDLLKLKEEQMRRVRGSSIAMIFQDPMSSLHPYYRVGRQLVEAIRLHNDCTVAQARTRSLDLLGFVGIPDPSRRIDNFPHEFSGGMRQRVMIAMALCNDPKVLIADEPTTALDVTVQDKVLRLIGRLQRELGTSVIFITHDLGVVASTVDEVAVMYAGQIVEQAPVAELFRSPQHPYTWGLLGSIPDLESTSETRLIPIPGRPPSLIDIQDSCAFRPRCRWAKWCCDNRALQLNPDLPGKPGHLVRCGMDPVDRKRAWAEVLNERTADRVSAAMVNDR